MGTEEQLPAEAEPLTAREAEVAALLGEYTLQEIADLLVVERETVKTHAENIRAKLGVQTSREAGRVYSHKSPETGDSQT